MSQEDQPQTGPSGGEFVDGAEHVIGTDPRRVPDNIDPDTGLPKEDQTEEQASGQESKPTGKTKMQ